jgi:simple sugar transport system ATP-binding protein
MTQHSVLSLQNITKSFGPVVANDSISIDLAKGEMLALLGENGAGKTTLMNILFGHYVADKGRVLLFGKELPQGSPRAALERGVGMVHQHFTLAENMTVVENIVLGTRSLFSLRLHLGAAVKRIRKIGRTFGLTVDPGARVADLSVGQRQRVEILKALYRDAKILILDEPTAVLTPQESDQLFATLRTMTEKGLSVIFITHKLREVMRASDRCVVLRHGKVVHETDTAATSSRDLAHAMIGGSVPVPHRESRKSGRTVLALDGVSVTDPDGTSQLKAVDLAMHEGEILGIAGVSGNGQARLADLLCGLITPDEGTILLNGRSMTSTSPMTMIRHGMGRIPDDRLGTGLIGDMSVLENLSSEIIHSPQGRTWGCINFKKLRRRAEKLIAAFDIRCPGLDGPVRNLSGGNMQKLILARILSEKPLLILANQPTWGLDVGATAFVHQQLLAARKQGAALVVISEDLDELFLLADRIQVMHEGRLSPPVRTEDTDRTRIGLLMSGQDGRTRSQGAA